MRILVTGSRTWIDEQMIGDALWEHCSNDLANGVLVHGACPMGADEIASRIWSNWGGKTEAHPADWARLGRAAGFIRNAEMVKLGADVCLAFIHRGSKGATHTAQLAGRAGIPTIIFRAE